MYRGLFSVLAAFTAAIVGCADSKKEAEAKWAKEVAQHFLDAFAAGNAGAMKTASTKAYAAEITNLSIEGGPVKFTITSQEMSPNLEQASVKGVVDFKGVGKRRAFTILMEKEEGRWKVSSFSQGAFQ